MHLDLEAVALTGGTWQPVGGIVRWVPDPVTSPAAYLPPNKVIACPTCHARADQTCRTKNGHRTNDHGARRIPRCCPCGDPVDPRCRYCDYCAREIALEAKREARARLNQAA